jgi:prepilin signal peptidase PulO-like enzyme (type II secretory pathway)
VVCQDFVKTAIKAWGKRRERPMTIGDQRDHNWLMIYFLVGLFGGYTASFVCLVLERRAVGRAPDGRSMCVCGALIPMYRNVPIVTWLVQRGKTHCCGSTIPVWYFGAELGVTAMAVAGALALHSLAPLGGALGTFCGVFGVWGWKTLRNLE